MALGDMGLGNTVRAREFLDKASGAEPSHMMCRVYRDMLDSIHTPIPPKEATRMSTPSYLTAPYAAYSPRLQTDRLFQPAGEHRPGYALNCRHWQPDLHLQPRSAVPGKLDLRNASCHWEGLNSSSLLEPIVRLYNMTGQREHLDFAGWIVSLGGIQSENIFKLACEDRLGPYEYPVTKAYEMTSCFEGLLEYARASRSPPGAPPLMPRYRQAYDIALQDGGTVRVVDYASAGQDYSRQLAAWLPADAGEPS